MNKRDIDLVIGQTECTEKQAIEALDENGGDLVGAIMDLEIDKAKTTKIRPTDGVRHLSPPREFIKYDTITEDDFKLVDTNEDAFFGFFSLESTAYRFENGEISIHPKSYYNSKRIYLSIVGKPIPVTYVTRDYHCARGIMRKVSEDDYKWSDTVYMGVIFLPIKSPTVKMSEEENLATKKRASIMIL